MKKMIGQSEMLVCCRCLETKPCWPVFGGFWLCDNCSSYIYDKIKSEFFRPLEWNEYTCGWEKPGLLMGGEKDEKI